jgi:hypothetical protein
MPGAVVAVVAAAEAAAAAPVAVAAAAAAAGARRRCGEVVFQPHRCVFLHNHRLKAHSDSPLYLLDVFFMSAQQITPHLQPIFPPLSLKYSAGLAFHINFYDLGCCLLVRVLCCVVCKLTFLLFLYSASLGGFPLLLVAAYFQDYYHYYYYFNVLGMW